MWNLKTRKRLVVLQALAILIGMFHYGMRATGQEEGRDSNRILSSNFLPYLTARIPLGGSGVDEWLATTGHMNHARIRVHRRRIHRRYRGIPLWKMLPQLIGILYIYGNRKARAIWCYCSDMIYLYQLILKSVVFHALMEYGALVNETLLMMSGDIQSNPGPTTKLGDLRDLKVLLAVGICCQHIGAYFLHHLLGCLYGHLFNLWLDYTTSNAKLKKRINTLSTDNRMSCWKGSPRPSISHHCGLCVRCVSPGCLGVPSGVGRMVVGVILLLLILSGDIEINPGPVGQLTPEDLGEVIQALYEARAKWYHTGFQLKLPVGTLDAIQSEFSDTTDCITEMCIHWLKRIDLHPSWAALTKALESPLVGEGHLAQQLRDKYCRGREETITHVYPTSKPTPSGAPPISQDVSTHLTLTDILKELQEVSAGDWFELGVALGIGSSKLKDIEKDYPGDAWHCKFEVLDWWHRNAPDVSWKKLVDALGMMGGYDALLQRLRKKIPTQDVSTYLTLTDVMNELQEVSAGDWFELGVLLRIRTSKLKQIEKDHPRNARRCKLEVLDWWYQNAPDVSWEKLVDALGMMGGYDALLQRLRKKIPRGGRQNRLYSTAMYQSKYKLEYLLTKSDDPSVQSLAGVLPQKALQTEIEPGQNAGRYLLEMAKWKHWADGQKGVKVFPVEPESLQHYLTHIVEEDLERVTRAVTWIHQQANYPSPTGSRIIQSSLAELQRNAGEEYLRGFEAFAQARFIITGSSSQSFEWKGYGFKLHVPTGAFSEGCRMNINIKAGLAGQFEFPDESQLVSCIYWISCPQKFLEPVTLEIQHCGLIENSSQSSSLHFVVAKCSQPELPYKFKALDKGTFSPHSSYGSLQVSQFSFFGIFGKSPRYCSSVYYTSKGHNRWYMDFVITHNLEVHLEAIQTHYSSLAAEHGPHLEVEFERDRISLELPASELPNGWTITPLGPPVIMKQQVDDYKPRCRIPCCQLLVKCMECEKHVELEHRVNLQGAKYPFDFFTLACTAKPEGFAGVQGISPKPTLLELVKVNMANWYNLGLELYIQDAELETIRRNNPQNQDDCKRDMFRKWLTNCPEASYKQLIQALVELGEKREADRLCKKYSEPCIHTSVYS